MLACVFVGCSSPSAPTPVDATWTSRPTPSSAADAGASVDAANPDDVPEPVCALTGAPASTPGDVLVFSDEFDGTSVDTKKWNVGSGKRGPSSVINTTSPANATLAEGALRIRVDDTSTDPRYPYTSGYIESLGTFARTYGKVEFRARFPYAAGVWHAMWGRAWFESFPEIDIEILNTAAVPRSQVYFVNHWAAPPIPADQRRSYVTFSDTDVSTFHTYTVSWTPNHLEWAMDGVTKMQTTGQGVPTKPVYWIMNSWVGGWAGPPPVTTLMPVTFEVDYFRVYRVDGLIADPEIHLVNPADHYARTDAIRVAAANFDEVCAHVEMYDGGALVNTTSTAPYRFSLARLASGPHALMFVATDGARRTSTTLQTRIQ